MSELGLPFFARETAPVDPETRLANVRLEVFMRRFEEAARACGVRVDEGVSLKECAGAIVKAAKASKLDPKTYQLAWFVRKTCSSAQQPESSPLILPSVAPG